MYCMISCWLFPGCSDNYMGCHCRRRKQAYHIDVADVVLRHRIVCDGRQWRRNFLTGSNFALCRKMISSCNTTGIRVWDDRFILRWFDTRRDSKGTIVLKEEVSGLLHIVEVYLPIDRWMVENHFGYSTVSVFVCRCLFVPEVVG